MAHKIYGILGNASALLEGARRNLQKLDVIQDKLGSQVDLTIEENLTTTSFSLEAEIVAATWFLTPEVQTLGFAKISQEYPKYSIALDQWAIFNEPATNDFKDWEAFLSK